MPSPVVPRKYPASLRILLNHDTNLTKENNGVDILKMKQWDSKIISFKRGMKHYRQCNESEHCNSALCHSVRRLIEKYKKHNCVHPTTSTCKICKLWKILLEDEVDTMDDTRVMRLTHQYRARNHRMHLSTLPSIQTVIQPSVVVKQWIPRDLNKAYREYNSRL